MNNQILTLAKDLIAIPSVSGEIEESVAILELAKKQLAEYPFTPFASNSIPSLLYSNKGKDIKDFKIILNTHLDVVPANESNSIHLKETVNYSVEDPTIQKRRALQ